MPYRPSTMVRPFGWDYSHKQNIRLNSCGCHSNVAVRDAETGELIRIQSPDGKNITIFKKRQRNDTKRTRP